MPLRVIEADPAETFYSMRDRLLRGSRGRTVVVLPEKASPLSSLDLVLLRRLAARERLDIGLVTTDGNLIRQARAVGLPAFSSVALAEHYRPGWWRAGRASERVGFAPGQDRTPPTIAQRGLSDASTVSGRRARLARILPAILVLVLLVAATLYTLPRATVALRVTTLPGQVIVDLTANPALTAILGNAIPAREARHEYLWEASAASSGDDAADRRRIRALALQGLHAEAPEHFRVRLEPGEILVDNSVSIEIIDESFIRAGETSMLTLTVVSRGWVVDEADIRRVALRELAAALPDGFTPEPSSVRFEVASTPGSSTNSLRATAQAIGRAEIDGVALVETLRGQRLPDMERYLATELPVESFTVDVWPGWWQALFGRMPWRFENIKIGLLP